MNYFNINGCPSQHGKVAIVTGANVGLGFETSLSLIKKEMTVVMACRDLDRGEAAKKKIRSVTQMGEVEVLKLDLKSRKSVEEFSAHFLSRYRRLDILINNAGIMVPPYQVTEDGWESQMAVNYVNHFLLSSRLFQLLDTTPGARVVSLSSVAHRRGRIDFDDINSQKKYSRFKAYAQSKLACLIFALELDRRLRERGSEVQALAAHPGLSFTQLGRHAPKILYGLFYPLIWMLTQSAADGAEPLLLAALGYPGNSKEIKSGEYFGPSGFQEWWGRAGKAKIAPHAQDPDIGRRLWEMTEDLLGIDFFSDRSSKASLVI